MWTNIKLCLTTYMFTIVLVLPYSTVNVRVLCVFTNYKIIDFCSWRTYKKKLIRMYSILFYIRIQLVTGARDLDLIATLSLSYFNVMTWSL